MAIDSGAVDAHNVALVGARNLDRPEEEFIAEAGVRLGAEGVELVLAETSTVYVALDADAFDAAEISSFMPEPGGIPLDRLEALLASIPRPAGAGFSGLVASERNARALARLGHALGL
jgi:arginase family enzyme